MAEFKIRKRWIALASLAVMGLSAAAATAAGVNIPVVNPAETKEQPFVQDVAKPHAELLSAVSSLASASGRVSADKSQFLLDHLAFADDKSPLSTADYRLARAVSTGHSQAFLVPAGDQACIIVQSAEGFAATCATTAEIKERGAAIITTNPDKSRTAIVLVPDGDQAPSIVENGKQRAVPVNGNVAVTTSSAGVLKTRAGSISLDSDPVANK